MKSSLFDVSSKVAVVTGGRRGIGRAFALALLAAGCKVAVISKSPDFSELQEVAETTLGGSILCIQSDLSERTERAMLIDRIVGEYGKIDILVNNAGIQVQHPALDYPPIEFDRVMSINLSAVLDLSQQAAYYMIPQRSGKIVNVASIVGFLGARNSLPYVASKHAVIGLTKCLSNEWAPHGIQVNAIAPGYIETDMLETLTNDRIHTEAIVNRIPAGRLGKPADLIGVLLYLCSHASDYVTGTTVVVDGGFLAR